VSGKALVAISDPAITGEAAAQGASLAVVAAGYQINPECIMSLASSPIKTPADLIGKKIGVGSADEPEWQAFLKVNNIPAGKVDTVAAGFDPSPVASGEWDGYLAFANNEPPEFAAKGIKTQLLLFQDYGLPELNEIYIVTTDTLSNPQQRKKAAAFLAGEIQGWTRAVSDPALAAQITVDKYAAGLGLDYQGEYLAALATNSVTVSAQTKANGVLSFSESQVAQTIETLGRAGVKASPQPVRHIAALRRPRADQLTGRWVSVRAYGRPHVTLLIVTNPALIDIYRQTGFMSAQDPGRRPTWRQPWVQSLRSPASPLIPAVSQCAARSTSIPRQSCGAACMAPSIPPRPER
jgi:ABC-type nitrate/sulfonate/bicarbonate transport system substrate-binding protein